MTLTVKESFELESLAQPGSHTDSSQSVQNLRSNPVCLEVPVTIRSLPADKEGTVKPVQEDARTVIVFENGAVLRLSANLSAGQAIIVKNPQGHEVTCRVAAARNLPNIKGYIEVEFVESVNDFWGIHRPSGQTNVPIQPAPAATLSHALPSQTAVSSTVDPSVEMSANETNHLSGYVSRNAPSFEDIADLVQMSPAPSLLDKSMAPVSRTAGLIERNEFAKGPQETAKPALQLSAPPQGKDLRPSSVASQGMAVPAQIPSEPITDDFGGKGRNAVLGSALPAASVSRGRIPLIIAGAAVILVGIGAGIFVVHRGSASSNKVSVPAVAQQFTPALPSAPEARQPSQASESSAAPLQPVRTGSENSEASSRAVAEVRSAPQAPPRNASSTDASQPDSSNALSRTIPNLKLTAPAATNRNAAALGDDSAPVTDAASAISATGAPIGGMLSTFVRTDNPPAPPPSTRTFVDAKLISTVRPEYPSVAKQANIQGIVVVVGEVDATGKVTGATVASGPSVLRQAAIDAVKQWKYQPAQVNGKPVSARVTVNVDFRL